MLQFAAPEMSQERFFYYCRKHGVAVFVAFAGSNYDLVLGKIDIFDPQTPEPSIASIGRTPFPLLPATAPPAPPAMPGGKQPSVR